MCRLKLHDRWMEPEPQSIRVGWLRSYNTRALGLASSFSQRWQGDYNNNRLHNICESANYFSERKNHI